MVWCWLRFELLWFRCAGLPLCSCAVLSCCCVDCVVVFGVLLNWRVVVFGVVLVCCCDVLLL